MNKTPAGSSRRSEIEKELIGDIEERSAVAETGKSHDVSDPYSKKHMAAYRQFSIKQGVRRRHPERVLAQFAQIVKETSNAESAWEKALLHEQQRTEVPTEYKPNDGGMIANQTGLVTTALDNFSRSKGKFERTFLTGV